MILEYILSQEKVIHFLMQRPIYIFILFLDYSVSCETDELIFDKTILKMSLVQEFGFVCDRW